MSGDLRNCSPEELEEFKGLDDKDSDNYAALHADALYTGEGKVPALAALVCEWVVKHQWLSTNSLTGTEDIDQSDE